jgi:acyl-CoA synthetase (AMP-forming)/AMP-acid ligase II
MPLFEAVRLALDTIRVQKLKSFFTLLGVTIGVTFLIAVVSIVHPQTKPEKLAYLLRDCRPRALIADASLAGTFRYPAAQSPHLATAVLWGPAGGDQQPICPEVGPLEIVLLLVDPSGQVAQAFQQGKPKQQWQRPHLAHG